jgi:hypothetical protein
MKKIVFISLAVLGFVLLNIAILSGQVIDTTGINDPILPEDINLNTMTFIYNAIYGALVILWGYIAKVFGWHTTGKNGVIFSIIAAGIVLAISFKLLGFSSGLPLAIAFLSAIGFYNIFLKPAGLKVTRIK